MKQILFFLLLAVIGQSINAQNNVGIGTTSPSPSAQLDVSSTSKGLLIPRMTSAQRIAIATPANGLMVYETTTNSFWFYNSSVWNQIGTGGASPWTISGANIYNSNTGNVGIGTSAPASKFHVVGNMLVSGDLSINQSTASLFLQSSGTTYGNIGLSTVTNDLSIGTTASSTVSKLLFKTQNLTRMAISVSGNVGIGTTIPSELLEVNGNILADNNIVATGILSGATITTPGNLTVSGTSFLNGNVTTNSDLIINNPTATIQLKSSSVNKGFYQLSGDNVRFGTNSGNTGGDVILRMDGDDMIKFQKSPLGAVMQMNINGTPYGVLQPSSLGGGGGVSLTATNPNGLVLLGGEVFINSTTNSTGIGTTTPLSKLHILNGGDASLTTNGYLMLGPVTGANLIFDNNEIMARSNGAIAPLVLQNDGGTVRIGNVAVPSGYKFAVNGKMICEEVNVKLASSGWPDYVFADNYNLQSLKEVEKFIADNKHLPNIPSAREVEKSGIELGEMNRKLLEKVEELTLYIIAQNKRLIALENQLPYSSKK
jgi:hypothetical protein